jgi:hypothetical protein
MPVVSITGGGTFETGFEINGINLTWTWNKPIESQSINNGIGALPKEDRAYFNASVNITDNTTYTVTGTDGTTSVSDSTSFTFRPRRFWGVSSEEQLSDVEILALEGSDLNNGRAQSRLFDCSGSRYFYIVYPSAYGEATFTVGGFNYTNYELVTQDVVNAHGQAISYHIYRSGLIQTGSGISVVVS